jgi:hypothetical protein
MKKNDPLWQDFGAGQVVEVFGLIKVYKSDTSKASQASKARPSCGGVWAH